MSPPLPINPHPCTCDPFSPSPFQNAPRPRPAPGSMLPQLWLAPPGFFPPPNKYEHSSFAGYLFSVDGQPALSFQHFFLRILLPHDCCPLVYLSVHDSMETPFAFFRLFSLFQIFLDTPRPSNFLLFVFAFFSIFRRCLSFPDNLGVILWHSPRRSCFLPIPPVSPVRTTKYPVLSFGGRTPFFWRSAILLLPPPSPQ